MNPASRRLLPKDPWWHVVGLSLGLLFVLMLAVARLTPHYLDLIDAHSEQLIAPFQVQPYVDLALVVTALGSGLGITLVTVGAAYFLRRNRHVVLQLALTVGFASFSMGIAKAFVERARPETVTWVEPLSTFSFPSGHATMATALYGFLAVQVYRRTPPGTRRAVLVSLPLLVSALVGASRIVLGYHYFTDVVAGILLGSFWLCVVFMLPKP